MSEQHIRAQLVNMLTVGQAHMTFEDAIRSFPPDEINARAANVEYTFWHLLEHLRLCQIDILDYIRNPNYQEPHFPDDLWPARDAVTDEAGWQKTIQQFLEDRAALVAVINDPKTDLYSQIPHGYEGHTILREILVVADHNAYHIGEFGILRHIQGHRDW
jgi:hypothetical protein